MSKIITIQDVMDNEVSLQEASDMSIMHQGEIFTYFDEGLTRFVFVNEDKTKVIKLEKEKRGTHFNNLEDEIYRNASEENRKLMAETKLINGFIEQEYVEPIKFGSKKLSMSQIRFAQSCRNEVGWRGDDLVCYDLDEFKKY